MSKIFFYYPYKDDLSNLECLNIDYVPFWNDWQRLTLRAMILRTYLILHQRGLDVNIGEILPNSENNIIIFLSDKLSLNTIGENIPFLKQSNIYVSLRVDEIEYRPFISDIEILHNGKYANGIDSFFIPNWPQPGIIPRNPSRGNNIINIVFKGGLGSLDSQFTSSEWYEQLSRRNINFIMHTEKTKSSEVPEWHNYEDNDLVLAVRPQFDGGLRSDKPAVKLINSWHAGCPSLLGKEYAFREIRKSEHDYIEVTNVKEAIAAIDQLNKYPHKYEMMIHNCKKRAAEYSYENIGNLWIDLLYNKIPAYRYNLRFRMSRKVHPKFRKLFYFVFRFQSVFEYRKLLGSKMRDMFK